MTARLGRLQARGEAAAKRGVEKRAGEIAQRLAETLPAGVAAERAGGEVVLSGSGLRRRYERDAALRWSIEGTVR